MTDDIADFEKANPDLIEQWKTDPAFREWLRAAISHRALGWMSPSDAMVLAFRAGQRRELRSE